MTEPHPVPTPEETAQWQRRLAAQANNRAWALAEQPARSADEDEQMLQAAHAAAHFWNIVGQSSQKAHAQLLLAHVYALLKLPNPARHYLRKCEAQFLQGQVAAWERACAHAVVAHVAHVAGDAALHREHHAQAQARVAALEDPHDRELLLATLRVIPTPWPAAG